MKRKASADVLADIERDHEKRRREQIRLLADGYCVPRYPRLSKHVRKALRKIRWR